mmetsp:Transcript_31255/g.61700  ORF Transcript_31255/g.61700 Transcript_31255/m.61700 type:complete len:163 (-) Transcript_31255:514-1002(-)
MRRGVACAVADYDQPGTQNGSKGSQLHDLFHIANILRDPLDSTPQSKATIRPAFEQCSVFCVRAAHLYFSSPLSTHSFTYSSGVRVFLTAARLKGHTLPESSNRPLHSLHEPSFDQAVGLHSAHLFSSLLFFLPSFSSGRGRKVCNKSSQFASQDQFCSTFE